MKKEDEDLKSTVDKEKTSSEKSGDGGSVYYSHSTHGRSNVLEYLKNIPRADLLSYSPEKKANINEEIARKQKILNDGLQQDNTLKKITLIILFIFLGIETIIVFVFAYMQSTSAYGFHLEEWSFKLLLSATLIQITYMLQVAVKHLFPTK